jgi:hypothetical protein
LGCRRLSEPSSKNGRHDANGEGETEAR